MQVTTDVQTFKKALATVKPGVCKPAQCNLPGLTGAHLEARNGKLTITTTNLDLKVSTALDVEIGEEGRALVPHAQLVKMLKGKGTLELKGEGDTVADWLTVTNGSTSTVRALNADEWPIEKVAPAGEPITLDLDAIAAVLPAASHDGARPILTGILFRGQEIVATDSYRLHRVIVAGADYPEMLIPWDALAPVVKHGGPATLVKGDHDVTITAGATVYTSRLIEGEFPNYKQLIPDNIPNSFTFDRDAMLHALEPMRAQVKLGCGGHPVKMIGPGPLLDLVVTVRDVGEARAQVTIGATGEDVAELRFNPEFLASVVGVADAGPVTLQWTDNLKLAMLTQAGPVRTLDRLIMPVRLS